VNICGRKTAGAVFAAVYICERLSNDGHRSAEVLKVIARKSFSPTPGPAGRMPKVQVSVMGPTFS